MKHDPGSLILGVDGGGSGCRVALARCNGATRLAEARGGAANVSSNFDSAIAAILSAINAVAKDAGITADTLRTVPAHLGLAGVLNDDLATQVAAALPFDHVTVSDDRETSLIGALSGKDGTVLSVGTGSFGGRLQGGDTRFVGGWGFQIGDQASGAWLGRALLAEALLCHDGLRAKSDLLAEVLAEFSDDPAEIVAHCHAARTADYAARAPQIVAAAKAGDAAAHSLMKAGAAYLTEALAALGTNDREPICLLGGLGDHYRAYLDQARAAQITPAKGNALDGALYLARQGGKV